MMYQNNGGASDKQLDEGNKVQARRETPPQIEYVADYTTKNEIINMNTETLRREKN